MKSASVTSCSFFTEMAAWLLNDLMSGPEIPTKTELTVSPVIRSASVTLCRIDFTVASTFTTAPLRIPSVGHSPIPRISTPSCVFLPRTVVTWLDPTSSPAITCSFVFVSIHSPGRMKTRPSVLRSAIPEDRVIPDILGMAASIRRIASLTSIVPTLSCSPASRVTTV